MDRKEQLNQFLSQLGGSMEALTAAAAAENRALTDEEQAQFNKFSADFAKTEQEIANIERVEQAKAKIAQPVARVVQPLNTAPAGTVPVYANEGARGAVVAHNHANHGFTKGMGEFLMAVRESAIRNHTDPRLLVNAVSTFGGETVGADGGFALPPQYAAGIMSAVMAEDSFLTALNPIQTSSNMLVVPQDEDVPWAATGITGAKTAEGAAITQSKPAIKKLNIVLHTISSLVSVSEQSLSDMPFLASFVQNKMAEKIRYKMENYVMNGTGEDEPLGIKYAPGLLVLSDLASTASVIAAEDIFNMKASSLKGTGAFWLVNPTVLPMIWALKSDATAGYPLYSPDMRQSPEGALLGLPVYSSEACPIFNAQNDINLVVPNGYILALNGGVNTASTIAWAFDQQLQSFRASVRMGGAPTLSAKIARASSGSSYVSNLVCLQASRS